MALIDVVDDGSWLLQWIRWPWLLWWMKWFPMFYMTINSCSRWKIVVTKMSSGAVWNAANLPQLHILFCRPRVSTWKHLTISD